MSSLGEGGANDARLCSIAFYLPQYHPIPENDEWWGAGYTEWRRVVRGRPQFRGHEQPRLPGELGFYDLRVPEVRAAQADLAQSYGIDAFCYYHYWFAGRRLLEAPFQEVLLSGTPSLPFLLCWANEPWTRAWDGSSRDVLIEQTEDPDDAAAFARDIIPALADPRYFRLDGRPVVLVYRAGRLQDPVRTTDTWRAVVTTAGIAEPFLCRVESAVDERGDPTLLGFDAAVEFQPDWAGIERTGSLASTLSAARRRARSLRTIVNRHRVIDYDNMVSYALGKPEPGYRRFSCVTPGWDNSVRRNRGATIVTRGSPDSYERWVAAAAHRSRATSNRLLFVNAWNEWGEGCHLEPDARHHRAYLEAHQRGLAAAAR